MARPRKNTSIDSIKIEVPFEEIAKSLDLSVTSLQELKSTDGLQLPRLIYELCAILSKPLKVELVGINTNSVLTYLNLIFNRVDKMHNLIRDKYSLSDDPLENIEKEVKD